MDAPEAVSYTHLDVYKRQTEYANRELKKKCWADLVQIFIHIEDADEAD